MGRQTVKDRSVLVMGVETAPARSAALQLCREKAKVAIGSRDYERLDTIAETLKRKKVEVLRAEFPEDSNEWEKLLVKVRDFMGHIHLIVNAHALTWKDESDRQTAQDEANYFNEVCAELLKDHGPLKIVTLWEEGQTPPEEPGEDVWHSVIKLSAYQRLDTEQIPYLEAGGVKHLRAGAIADAVLSALTFPPGACPEITLKWVASSEKTKS